MRLTVAPDVLTVFPTLTLGILRGRVSAPRGDLAATIAGLRSRALASLTARAATPEALAELPTVVAWREAYRAFGVKPTKFRPTHEALARRLLKDGSWPEIHPIVDIYLTNQIDHLLPHGGYDSSTLAGDLSLYVSPGGEPFQPLGGGEEVTDAGEIVYRDATRVLTRRWNFRDCEATQIRSDSTEFVLMIEAPIGSAKEQVETACNDLAARYQAAYEGTFRAATHVVDESSREVPLD